MYRKSTRNRKKSFYLEKGSFFLLLDLISMFTILTSLLSKASESSRFHKVNWLDMHGTLSMMGKIKLFLALFDNPDLFQSLLGFTYFYNNCRLRTSLCLQFRPHQVAAGAIFLAANFLKIKLPSNGGKAWWQEFEVTPRELEGWYCFTMLIINFLIHQISN